MLNFNPNILRLLLSSHLQNTSQLVNKAIKGWGTNDNLLIRVLVTRDEIDMPQIKQYYKQLYGKDMLADIKSDCSGDYQKLLIELAGH